MISPHEKIAGIHILKSALAVLEAQKTRTQCSDCINWGGGHCKKWGEPIPAEIQSVGCDEWVFDPSSPPF